MKRRGALLTVFSRQCRIFYEHVKVPGRIIHLGLSLAGWYRRGVANAADVCIVRHNVAFPHLPPAFDGYQLLIMSDLHFNGKLRLGEHLCRLLPQAAADALVLLGDYRYHVTGSHHTAVALMKQILSYITVRDGLFAVRGNHDSHALMEELSNASVVELNNRSVALERNGQSLHLVGVDDPHYDRADDLQAALAQVPRSSFKILLAHTAELYRQASAAGIDLYLCGHTHGGQIRVQRLGAVITNVRAPRAWAHGFWRFNDMCGYTTSGVGTSAVPVRFNCPPEIVVLTLKKGVETL
jgi:uncharacterized protein